MNISKKSFLKNELLILAFCMALSAIFITICSKSSFIYPLQDWVDINCFHTIGRALADGKILYQDIFEQKGPALYFLYAFFQIIFGNNFFGAYLIEVLAYGLFLYVASKCIRLYTKNTVHIFWLLPLLTFAITVSKPFSYGGSVEGLSLAGLILVIYSLLKTVKFGTTSKLESVLNGICMGFIFWTKYTMIGVYIGAFLFIFVFLLIKKKYRELINIIIFTLIGFVAIALPIFIYFAINGAFYDLFYVYFYKNIFSYSYSTGIFDRIMSIVRGTAYTVLQNIFLGALVLLGFIFALTRRNAETLFLLVCAATWAFFTYVGGIIYTYYGLTIAPFAVFGVCAVALICDKLAVKFKNVKPISKPICALATIILTTALSIGSLFISPNTYLLKYEKEDLPQYIFAEKINQVEDATLLNYGFLDGGFYFAADITPPFKYFCELNVRSDEMDSEMDRYVTEAIPDFVVTRDHTLDEDFEEHSYTCIDTREFYYEGSVRTYYLYQKNSVQ